MWDSGYLRTHYATCQSLAFQIGKFMAKHHFFNTSTLEANELHGMIATMSRHLREAEDLWDEVAETTRIHGPDDPKNASLFQNWSNVVQIKVVVSNKIKLFIIVFFLDL